MIITKSGRRMFPTIRPIIQGLDDQSLYHIAVDIIPVDQNRYRYAYHKRFDKVSSFLVYDEKMSREKMSRE